MRVGICAALVLLMGVSLQLGYLLKTQRDQTRLLEVRYDAEAQSARELRHEVDALRTRLSAERPLR